MNKYIILDGKRYGTAHESWTPTEERPMVIRRLFSGGSNVTFGPATFPGWRGVVLVDVTATDPYGTIDDFRVTYRKREALTFVDHYGASCSVVIDRTIDERSLSPMWTAADNTFSLNLTLIKL